MNLKSIGLSAMLAGTATAMAVVAPAQAATISGETLGLGGKVRLETPGVAVGGTSRLNFSDFSDATLGTIGIPFGAGNVFGGVGTPITVKDFDLEKTSATTWALTSGSVTNWLTGMDNSVKFTLDTFDLGEVTAPGGGTDFVADITGVFRPSNLDGTGGFSAQGNFEFTDGSTFSADITAGEEIPTPALLPGLIGMGVAALRKRGSAEEETVEA